MRKYLKKTAVFYKIQIIKYVKGEDITDIPDINDTCELRRFLSERQV